MKKKIVSGIVIILLVVSILSSAFNILSVKASGTIYIRPDGSIDPPTAPILRDGDLYTLTGNITSDADGIVVEKSSITIDGNGSTLQGSGDGHGFHIYSMDNVTIRNAKIKNFSRGIYLYASSFATISENNIVGNEMTGVLLLYSSHSNICGNDIADNFNCIWLALSNSNNITGNLMHDSLFYGVALGDSHLNRVQKNHITNVGLGLDLGNSSGNVISENNLVSTNGIQLGRSYGNEVRRNRISNGSYGIRLWEAWENSISNNNIYDNLRGISLWNSSADRVSENNITASRDIGVQSWGHDNNISYNTITYTEYFDGIRLSGNDNTVTQNFISNNGAGMEMAGWNNTVEQNEIHDNEWHGIAVYGSGNTLTENNMTGNRYNFGVVDISTHWKGTDYCINNVDPSNTVNGRPIYYWINKDSSRVPDDAGYVAIINSTGITIENLLLSNNTQGIFIVNSVGCTIRNVTASHTEWGGIQLCETQNSLITASTLKSNIHGISLFNSNFHNTVAENILMNNGVGILAQNSSNNLFYHNNFLNNTKQVRSEDSLNLWHNDYPSAGNYWSDYTDEDMYCGPYQDILGRDGIWDHPYIIDANNTDKYPLVKPHGPGNLTVSTYTDKETYHAGETMHLGLNLANRDSVKYLCFAVWCELPDSSIHLYMHQHSVLLPIGATYSNPDFQTITLPNLPIGNYTWHAAFLERATHTIIVEDTAEWIFN